ncbi:S-adenosyl-L-methionine-dependent tRNA 4-demethylwyosine synthase TYW1 [Parasteatoda tepidariorum]|uniref:S-adenosyl-L-methionine-dependent tRNA 4-demethylwyosine synthase TYW1 n=1 Tax=Parasteatoda tepidariorum TaxID=114398 RepID=UPI000A2BFDBF|nr:S-adenosyl-L-methionine-dependent tRNA 4-demethylwyosine synthase TYW1 [Parasteatoda tepidariorum]XP_042901157.1 S-adenosyl-L-methionine-dependent tRNA 4-demethylwyosine synthase TYW1 [Parasteatoda tepidariorum]
MEEILISCIIAIVIFLGTFTYLFLWRRVPAQQIQRIQIDKLDEEKNSCDIIFASQTGNAKNFAKDLSIVLSSLDWRVLIIDMKELKEPEEYLISQASKKNICVFLASTFVEGQPPDGCNWFCQWLKDAAYDFRVSHSMLKGLKYAVFGLGNSLYEGNFNKVATEINGELQKLGASPILPLVKADENDVNCGLDKNFSMWKSNLLRLFETQNVNIETPIKNDSESGSEDEEVIMDVEELGTAFKNANSKTSEVEEEKEMITPLLRKSLTKQGYKLLGSHSGVKMCRWTKSMLRGRGGCYKHTFYGIESHRCMEATPSLACANKCVFCWRHHTNPVGTEWKWKMDDAQSIVDQALKNHYSMIKEFKGVPGVQPDKFAEGLQAKHCALSLVGEPIMYPEINKLIDLLHEKTISTFLVTNAQFPEAIKNLEPVTQLYVSVDASNEQSLKKIDRPLFKDFWQRFIDSLKELSSKGQRTVYRLTLVKAWNTDEMEGYANLVEIGRPDFIEIKGVTYCGTSNASSLTMENIPWHEEIYSFGMKLADYLADYELASEHEHSNCILLAHKKFLINGRWNTWIDYDKFHELIKNYNDSGKTKAFSSLDYVYPTPEWAIIGAKERGFDPKEIRFHRKSKKDISGC